MQGFLALNLIFLFSCFNLYAQELSVGVNTDGIRFLSQTAVCSECCGPVSIINALKTGNIAYKSIYGDISGESDKEKAWELIKMHQRLESGFYPNFGFDIEGGITASGLLKMFEETLVAHGLHEDMVQKKTLERQPDEPMGQYIERIHRTLAISLKRGIPVIIGVHGYVGVSWTDPVEWNWEGGHYVVITRVQKELKENAYGFTFDYVDPNGGYQASGYIYEELYLSFQTDALQRRHKFQSNEPVQNITGDLIYSPALHIIAPPLLIHQTNFNYLFTDRFILVLTVAIGDFSE